MKTCFYNQNWSFLKSGQNNYVNLGQAQLNFHIFLVFRIVGGLQDGCNAPVAKNWRVQMHPLHPFCRRPCSKIKSSLVFVVNVTIRAGINSYKANISSCRPRLTFFSSFTEPNQGRWQNECSGCICTRQFLAMGALHPSWGSSSIR